MSDNNNELLTQILQTLNTFQVQTTKSINDLREEVRENKREIQRASEKTRIQADFVNFSLNIIVILSPR